MPASKKNYTTFVVLAWPVVKHNAVSASSCTCGRQPPGIKIYAEVEKKLAEATKYDRFKKRCSFIYSVFALKISM